jgi:penicillin-binding protein 1C
VKLSHRARVLLGVLVGLPLAAFVTASHVPYPTERLAPAASTSLVITDRDGRTLRTLPLRGGGRASWVPLDRVAPIVIQATLAGEDQDFFEHDGVDAVAVVRALGLAAWYRRPVSGASTVTMQLVRLVQPHPKTLLGKLGEMADARRLEHALSKTEILEQYLNRAYYGNGAYGIEAAAQRYFGKPAAALSAGEGTLLAVLPRAPLGYDPYHHLDLVLARRRHVLELMERHGYLDGVGRAVTEAEPVGLATESGSTTGTRAPHFVDWVLAGLPPRRREQGGVLRTTLVLELQARLEAAVRAHLRERRSLGLRQAGAVVLDPATGAVLAMVGSVDYAGADGQVNITTTPRHPGSTLKPFVYALAIEEGDSPATLATDLRDHVPGYRPRRQMRQHGIARYREALGGSYNLAAVDVLDRVGVAPLLERLRQAGLGPLQATAPEYGLDLALGDARVRLVDLAAAYGFVVNGGAVMRARATIDQPVSAVRVFSPQVSYLVMDMLADPGARRASFGADLPFDLPFRVAAKTGTSSGFADTLAIAATREAVVAAWSGAFDGSGTRGALAMWSAAPIARAGLLAVRDWHGGSLTLPSAPDGVAEADVCAITGLRPGARCPTKHERFIEGTLPRETCAEHR